MKNCIIGVDGGNTKTDYFLFDLDGNYIDNLRDGQCCQHIIGFEKAEEIIFARIKQLLVKNGLDMGNVCAGGFGLAGIDNRYQRERFVEIFTRMGIPRFEVDNDGYLGIIAGTTRGSGICSINGTGTVTAGIDILGRRLQVGGMGQITGDDAGGEYIAQWGVRMVYDSVFRCGEKTAMTEPIFQFLEINEPTDLLCTIVEKTPKLNDTELTRIVFKAAALGDGPALEILDNCGKQLAKSSAGCVRNLDFNKDIEIVLAGSVWAKAEDPALFNSYKKYMGNLLPEKRATYNILRIPPATGAVLWALSLCGSDCLTDIIRNKVVNAVESIFINT